MLSLLRAVTRSSVYRTSTEQLASRKPDDVWYSREHGWVITFPLKGAKTEQLLMFALQEPASPGCPANITQALRVEREGDEVTSAVLFPPTAG